MSTSGERSVFGQHATGVQLGPDPCVQSDGLADTEIPRCVCGCKPQRKAVALLECGKSRETALKPGSRSSSWYQRRTRRHRPHTQAAPDMTFLRHRCSRVSISHPDRLALDINSSGTGGVSDAANMRGNWANGFVGTSAVLEYRSRIYPPSHTPRPDNELTLQVVHGDDCSNEEDVGKGGSRIRNTEHDVLSDFRVTDSLDELRSRPGLWMRC